MTTHKSKRVADQFEANGYITRAACGADGLALVIKPRWKDVRCLRCLKMQRGKSA